MEDFEWTESSRQKISNYKCFFFKVLAKQILLKMETFWKRILAALKQFWKGGKVFEEVL